jgi:two-component system, sensor histidine kinase and response regulator
VTPPASSRTQRHDRERSPGSEPKARILVVDDDPAKRLALGAALAPLGFDVVEADSGIAALRCVLEQDFAVILLDVRMPTMDGFETAALIRQRERSEMTPIIFITALSSDEMLDQDRYAQGAVDFIFAPVDPSELRAKVVVFANLFLSAEVLAMQARAAQISADELRLLTDVAPIGIFRTDTDNRYVYLNPRWCEITGIPLEEALGRKLGFGLGSEQRLNVEAQLTGALPPAEFSYRYEMSGPDSTARIAVLTAVAIPNTEGEIAGWAGTLADVTAESLAEAALSEARDAATAMSQLKSDFLANMSHEIRTPMNGVIGMTDLLLETDLDTRQRDYAQTVRDSGEALLAIINSILDFSKLEASMVQLDEAEFDLTTVINGVVDLLVGSARTKAVELVAVVDSSVPTVVKTDPGRLRQVLINLVGNAIKFTQTGEVVLRVSLEEATDAGTLVRFEVHDTGDGIAPEKLDEIFQPFVQADTSTSRRYGGTGLGLAISRQLVTLMGGNYGVASELGEGSTFWFTIRLLDGSRGIVEEPALNCVEPVGAGRTALVVDPSPSERHLLAQQLTALGLVVTTKDNLPAALVAADNEAVRGTPFSVALFSRSTMPGVDLTDPAAGHASLAATPLVLVVAPDERIDGSASTAAFAAVLTKPVRPDAIVSCLRTAMGLADQRGDPAVSRPESCEQATGRLLLAEDNLVNQKVAVAMLTSAGYLVDTVLDGEAAVLASAAHRYDAILMDCQMPGLSGYEATTVIRAREGTGRRTPILAMTASARVEDRDRCLAAGMDGYLAKPVSKRALLDTVALSVKNGRPRVAVELNRRADEPALGPDCSVVALDPARAANRDTEDRTRPALDARIIDQLTRLGATAGGDFMSQLARLFLADAESHLVDLRQGFMDSDVDRVTRTAHTLSGSSANVGAEELARLCASAATESGAQEFLGNESLLEAVESELGRVRSALDEYIAVA